MTRSLTFALFALLLAVSPAGSGSLTLLGAGKAQGGGGGGPPVLTFNSNGLANPNNAAAQTISATLPSTGGPYWVGVSAGNQSNGITLSSIAGTPTNGTMTCSIDTQATGASTVAVALGHCITSAANPGITTITVTWSAIPFNSTEVGIWTAPSSGFNSTSPITSPASNVTAAAATTNSVNANATNAGFCLLMSVLNDATGTATTSYTGSTYTFTQRFLSGGGQATHAGADAPATTTGVETASITWTISAVIGITSACWF